MYINYDDKTCAAAFAMAGPAAAAPILAAAQKSHQRGQELRDGTRAARDHANDEIRTCQ